MVVGAAAEEQVQPKGFLCWCPAPPTPPRGLQSRSLLSTWLLVPPAAHSHPLLPTSILSYDNQPCLLYQNTLLEKIRPLVVFVHLFTYFLQGLVSSMNARISSLVCSMSMDHSKAPGSWESVATQQWHVCSQCSTSFYTIWPHLKLNFQMNNSNFLSPNRSFLSCASHVLNFFWSFLPFWEDKKIKNKKSVFWFCLLSPGSQLILFNRRLCQTFFTSSKIKCLNNTKFHKTSHLNPSLPCPIPLSTV